MNENLVGRFGRFGLLGSDQITAGLTVGVGRVYRPAGKNCKKANRLPPNLSGRRLTPPTEVCNATADYRSNEDVIGQFFGARVRPDDKGSVKAVELYQSLRMWW